MGRRRYIGAREWSGAWGWFMRLEILDCILNMTRMVRATHIQPRPHSGHHYLIARYGKIQ